MYGAPLTTTAEPAFEAWSESAPPHARDSIAGKTPFQLFWERFREDRVALALLAPWIVKLLGHPPNAQYPETLDPTYGTPTGPSRDFLFGVDTVGRDVFARVLYGARVSLQVALVATALSVGLGVVAGMLAGFNHLAPPSASRRKVGSIAVVVPLTTIAGVPPELKGNNGS